MTKLTPAAEAVSNAFWYRHEYPDSLSNEDLSAAIRAAVNEVISPVPPPCSDSDEYERGFLAAHIKYRGLLLALADELEAQ
jgi:hypothetical protein